jgi:ADP-heptose:LPS heptosyltransferase
MNIKTMKFMDSFVGIPVCLLLMTFAKFKRIFIKPKKNIEPQKILLMKFFGMGSIILGTPMIRALKQKYPDAEIYFLTFAGNQEICKLIEHIDRVYSIRTRSFHLFAKDLIQTIHALRKKKCDVSIDMEFFSKFSVIMSTLIGAQVKIGFFLREIWRENLLDYHIYYNHYKHLTEIYGNMIRPLGVECSDFSLYKPPSLKNKREKINLLLRAEAVSPDESIVCINVNASDLCPERKWPKENFISLISKISDNFPLKIILIGSPGEHSYVQQVYQNIPRQYKENIIDLSGKTDVYMLLELFRMSELLITNDSGPLHFAEMVGLKTISFFGPETPLLYGPIGKRHTVFFKDLYCSPCLNVYNVKTALCNGDNKCMQSITVDEVFAEISRILTHQRKAKKLPQNSRSN